MDASSVDFVQFDENEEATLIQEIVLIRVSLLKCLLMVPVLSVITGLVYLLVLYWSPKARFLSFFSKTTLDQA